VPETLHATGRITAREKAIVAGTGAAGEVFRQVDPSMDIQMIRPDGDEVVPGDLIIEVRGLARSILKAERVALNFLQHLCGIATLTRQFVDAIGHHPAKILDTRKTTPGLRALEKAAVVAGGGVNHRFGLYDMVLVKDNHLATLGDFPLLPIEFVSFVKSGQTSALKSRPMTWSKHALLPKLRA